MDQKDVGDIQRLQERIDAALKESPEDRRASNFSDYRPDHTPDLVDELRLAAEPGGIQGIEAALNKYHELATREDLLRMKHALMLFLMHYSDLGGLRIPSLEERSPWKVLPSKRKS